MSLRATSHGELQTLTALKTPASDSGLFRSFSQSSNNLSGRFESIEEIRGISKPTHPPRRPVRAVRPISALGSSGSFIQLNHLQGELVRKRKECEELKKENKYLLHEIHMERIVLRNESELTMRNLRSLNQDLQAQVKEVLRSDTCFPSDRHPCFPCPLALQMKQKLLISQQRAALCSRAAEDADRGRTEAEKSRALAETRALEIRQDKEMMAADKTRLSEELQHARDQHNDVQLLLAQTEKKYFETKLKLDRVCAEKQAAVEQSRALEEERNTLRRGLKEQTEENIRITEKEMTSRHRAQAAEEQRDRADEARQEAERERRAAERERQEHSRKCLSWREKHQVLADVLRAHEELKSQRQNKACQANIKSYFLCMTESDQRVKILKSQDGSPRNFTEGDPVYISTPELSSEEPENSGRLSFRVAAPRTARDPGPGLFSELSPLNESGPSRRSRKVEYFWIPTDEE